MGVTALDKFKDQFYIFQDCANSYRYYLKDLGEKLLELSEHHKY